MTPDKMKTLVERYIDAYNRMNVDEMLLTVHPDVEFKNVSSGVVNASTAGISELRESFGCNQMLDHAAFKGWI